MHLYFYSLIISLLLFTTYIAIAEESQEVELDTSLDSDLPEVEDVKDSINLEAETEPPIEDEPKLLEVEEVVDAEVSVDGEKFPDIPVDQEGVVEGVGDSVVLPNIQGEGNRKISGVVYDAESGRGLPGVNVSIPILDLFTRTDVDGNFSMEGVHSGAFEISVVKLGYTAVTESIVVKEGEDLEYNQDLVQKPVETDDSTHVLDEYDVVAEYVEEEDITIDLGGSTTGSLVSGISDVEFAKQAISDAGDAVEKVTGANIVDGKFAVVRGLADRYVSTTFNGAAIPSADPSRKSVALDLFPSSTIQSIDVAKTHNPSLSGDFGGAAIDIQTKNFPENPVFSLKAKYEYDTNLPSDFLVHPNQSLGFFGDLGRTPNLGNILAPNANGVLRVAQLDNTPTEEERAKVLAAYSEFIQGRSLVPKVDSPEQEKSFGFTYGDSILLTQNTKLGFLFSLGQKNEDSYNKSEEFRIPNRSWTQEDYTRSREWNAYLATGLEIGEYDKVSATYFKKSITEHNVRHGSNYKDPDNTVFGRDDVATLESIASLYGAGGSVTRSFYEIEPVQRELEIIQLQGEHFLFDEKGPEFRWSWTDSNATEVRPDTTFHEFAIINFSDFSAIERAVASQRADLAALYGRALNSFGLFSGQFNSLNDAEQFIRDNEAAVLATAFGGLGATAEDVIQFLRDSDLTKLDLDRESIATIALLDIAGRGGNGFVTSYGVQDIEEDVVDNNWSFRLPTYFGKDENKGVEFDFGYGEVERERKTRGNIFELVYENRTQSGAPNNGFTGSELNPSGARVLDRNGNNVFFSEGLGSRLVENSVFDFLLRRTGTSPFIQDGSIGTGNFTGRISNNIDAGHDIESYHFSSRIFLNSLEIRGGVRYEKERRVAEFLQPVSLDLATGEIPTVPTFEEDVWLPSISVSNRFFDDRFGVLAAWSRTTARPTFFEWVPTTTFDLTTGFFRGGDATLDNSTIENFDLSFDYRIPEKFALRLGLFKKEIEDPIVEVRSGSDFLTYINANGGDIAGIELEGSLDDLYGFSLGGNITYIDASLEYELDSRGAVEENFPFQPEWIANANLGYEYEPWRVAVNLVYNFTGSYATLLRTVPTDPNVTQNAQHSLDLIVRKNFGLDDEYSVTVGVKNLYSTDRELSFDFGDFQNTNDGQLRSSSSNDRLFFIDFKAKF